MKIKVVYCKNNNRVIIAECEGFYTIPSNCDITEIDSSEIEEKTFTDEKGNVYMKGEVQ